MDRETVSYMAQEVLEIGAVYAETFNEHEDDPKEGLYRLGCLCRMVGFFPERAGRRNARSGGNGGKLRGGGTYSAAAQ